MCPSQSSHGAQEMAEKKWGKAYYLGTENNDRVRGWRQHHPQYWKRKVGPPGCDPVSLR